MKKGYIQPTSAEPVGIVISRGVSGEPKPVCWAYVWGLAQEPLDEASRAA